MDETFDLPVTYNGKQLQFKARLLTAGFTHKILVDVNGTEISFEPDEERNYRAVINIPDTPDHNIDRELLQTITETLESTFKD